MQDRATVTPLLTPKFHQKARSAFLFYKFL